MCHTGRCDCVPAWTGSQCESLNLIQTPAALGYHAVARTDRTGTTERTASWGGSVVVGDDGTYHMYHPPPPPSSFPFFFGCLGGGGGAGGMRLFRSGHMSHPLPHSHENNLWDPPPPHRTSHPSHSLSHRARLSSFPRVSTQGTPPRSLAGNLDFGLTLA